MTNALRKYAVLLKGANMVARFDTQLSDLEFAKHLSDGFKIAFPKQELTAEILAGSWAQAVLESGRPIKLPNNNVGNIKATQSWLNEDKERNFFVKDAVEFTPEGQKYVESATKWRSYNSPAEGAAAYWRLIGSERYKEAMNWMAAGDPESASVVLGVSGYYTSNIKKYARYSNVLYKEFMDKIAPQLDMESNPAAPPGEKLAIKNFAKDYSREEKIAISGAKEIGPQDVETLITQLYANEGKLTKLVKNSILKEKLPVSDVLICVNGGDQNSKLEYARVTSSLLRKFIDADACVCAEDGEVEIQCSAIGTENVLSGAVKEICELVAAGINKHMQSKISVLVLSGLLSKHSAVEDMILIKNRRRFNMSRVLNG